jgi:hypothetical protein
MIRAPARAASSSGQLPPELDPPPGSPRRQVQLLRPPPPADRLVTVPGAVGSRSHWAVPSGSTRQESPGWQRVTPQGFSWHMPLERTQTMPSMHWTPVQPDGLHAPSFGSQ